MESILEKFKKTKGTIFITGESGTGKSYLAKNLHYKSERKNDLFLCLNLASVQESIIESELYGHERGAFTGAVDKRIGYLEKVGNGTLFLDEIAELSLASQKKLLCLLEEKEFKSVGSSKIKKFRGQVIAATNKDIKKEVKEGNFREDLYYRLMVFNIHIPEIKNNKKLISEMINYYLKYYKNIYSKSNLFIESKCFDYLINYLWPGNIREIKNCMEYVACLSNEIVTEADLPDWLKSVEVKINFNWEYPLAYRDALDMFEGEYLNYVLGYYQGQLNYTAKEIGISKTTLISKMKKLGIDIWKIKKAAICNFKTEDRLELVS